LRAHVAGASLAQRILAPYREGLSALDARGRRVVMGTFLFIAARMSVMTFLGIYLVEDLGMDLALVGLAFLVENLARGGIAPFAGALSDRIGRRPVILGSVAAAALLMPGFLLIQGPLTLLAWSLLIGLAQGPSGPSSVALLLDLVPAPRRQAALAVSYTALSLGYTVGVAPAGFLVERGYILLALASSATFALVFVLYAYGMRGPLPPIEPSPRSVGANALLAARDRTFVAFAVPSMLFPMGIGLLALVIPVYAADHGMEKSVVGMLLSGTGLLLALLSIPLNARAGVRGPFRMLPAAALLCAASYALFAFPPTVALLLAGLTLFTLGEVLFSSALPTAVAALAPPGSRGAYQGAWSLIMSVSIGAAFFLSGLLHDAFGWRGTWISFLVATLLSGLLLLLGRAGFRRVADARAGLT
jgi:MFS family permease